MGTDAVKRSWPSLIVFTLIVAGAASFGAIFQPGSWYEHLAKPSWNPPNWMFGPAWTALYVCIAIAGWSVWRVKGKATGALILWGTQMVLNAFWSFLFFGLHRPDIALVDILLLLATIVGFILIARKVSRLASGLFVPYALWVAFATSLNAAIWSLN